MEDVEQLLKTAMGEVERMLNTRTVVGDPIVIEGATLIPLVSLGFAIGAGGGTGRMKSGEAGEGKGAGTGGGGGVKPVALVIVDSNGVRLEAVKGGASSALEKVAETIGQAVSRKNAD